MQKPVLIDVFFLVPEGWGMCTTCEMMMSQADLGKPPEERGLDDYPPEWKEDFKRLSKIIFDLADKYQNRVQIKVWDPRSLQGMWRSIRHGVRRYPTFVLDEHTKMSGWDQERLEEYIQQTEIISESEI